MAQLNDLLVLGETKLLNSLPIESGGTGADNSEDALENLGIPIYRFNMEREKDENGQLLQRYQVLIPNQNEFDNLWEDLLAGKLVQLFLAGAKFNVSNIPGYPVVSIRSQAEYGNMTGLIFSSGFTSIQFQHFQTTTFYGTDDPPQLLKDVLSDGSVLPVEGQIYYKIVD